MNNLKWMKPRLIYTGAKFKQSDIRQLSCLKMKRSRVPGGVLFWENAEIKFLMTNLSD